MSAPLGRWAVRALGIVLLAWPSGCAVTGEGYVGGVYEEPGYDFGDWGAGYWVGPPRGREHRDEHHDEHRVDGGGVRRPEPARPAPPHAYRSAPATRPVPSIPTRPSPVHGRPTRGR